MAREVCEWAGKTDDTAVPNRVRDRIFERHNHRCHLCGNEIKAIEGFELDHIVALINSGKNTESNLAPAHKYCHKSKTVLDVKEKAKTAKARQKHLGIRTRPVAKIQSAPFAKSERTASRQPKQSLPYRALYEAKEETR